MAMARPLDEGAAAPAPAAKPRTPRWVADWGVSIAVVAIDTALLWDRAESYRLVGTGSVAAGAVLAYAALLVPLLAARRAVPWVVFLGVWAHAVVAHVFLLGYRTTLPLLLALFTVSLESSLRRSLGALALAAFVAFPAAASEALTDASLVERREVWISGVLLYLLLFAAFWALGRWVGARRRQIDDLEKRRAASARAAESAIRDERARIARDLHDIVAHSVTVMVLQSAAARLTPLSPDQTRRAFTDIETTGKQAMGELRRMLGVMSTSPGAPTRLGAGASEDPLPGLADLDRVVQSTRAAGLPVAVTEVGARRTLDPSVDLAALRVVQEGLTNALRHGGRDTHAEVVITWSERDVGIAVVNPVSTVNREAADGLSMGLGLLGLRERCKAAGGELSTSDLPDKGFRLFARFPVTQ